MTPKYSFGNGESRGKLASHYPAKIDEIHLLGLKSKNEEQGGKKPEI
jgi:hypothetical protein